MDAAAHDLWRFSLRVYRAPGVERACLALQDGQGADVNLLLFCGWLAGRGVALERRRLRQAMAHVRSWQSAVIVPLRSARHAHKCLAAAMGQTQEAASALHKRLLALELELEHCEQTALFELAASWLPPRRPTPPPQAAQSNLARYVELLGAALAAGSTAASTAVPAAMSAPNAATHVQTLVAAFDAAWTGG